MDSSYAFLFGARFLRNWRAATKFYVCLVDEKMWEEKLKQIITNVGAFCLVLVPFGILYYVGSRIMYMGLEFVSILNYPYHCFVLLNLFVIAD